jgi:GDP-L-fucose synthase
MAFEQGGNVDKNAKILVAGGTGMVGGALVRLLRKETYTNVLAPPRAELDLLSSDSVDRWFDRNHPDYVFMAGAKVGGIAANSADPVGFLSENVKTQMNLFEACRKYGTRKNMFLGSSCIYPRECPQPIRESYLMTGPLEPTNEGYALAKIMGLKMAEYYWRQHGMVTICPMPCNLYGTGDHFDFQRSHVLSSLVRRFVDAKDEGKPSLELWGTGSARREFLHVDDAAEIMLALMERYEENAIINMGPGVDLTIKELAGMIAEAVGYAGEIRWDPTKPDGMPRKCMEVSRMLALGIRPKIGLPEGIRRTIAEYRELKRRGEVR